MSGALESFPIISATQVRDELLTKREIALLDVREAAPHATGHPLFAANLPLSRLELDAYRRIPRRDVLIVLFDNGEGHAATAAHRLSSMGYTNVKLLDGGLKGWLDAGFEVFQDVNVPSKAFGELVEAVRHTPSFTAQQVQTMIQENADCVIVDARRYEEFQTMSIPTAISVPGAELVLRIRELAPRPETQVIVNCAGRTRSIIGTQSLINAGIPNPIAALRNGTIDWKLAHQQLAHGALDHFSQVEEGTRALAAEDARRVADKAGVARLNRKGLQELAASSEATSYCFDVRTPEEFLAGHLPGFRNAPGGQLVQETDMFVPVRGAHVVLADNDGTRANMTASWLAQMGWAVSVVDGLIASDFAVEGLPPVLLPLLPSVPDSQVMSVTDLPNWHEDVEKRGAVILDFATARQYSQGHIAGAWYALRSELGSILSRTSHAVSYILTSPDGVMARFAFPYFRDLTPKPTYLLEGGTAAWTRQNLPLTSSDLRFASEPIDRYQRPYEGIEAPASAMQAYLDWEYGLVDQLKRDGTHGFFVI